MIEATKLYTVSEAAEYLRKHQGTVERWCREGLIPSATKVGGHWLIPGVTLLDIAAHGLETGKAA